MTKDEALKLALEALACTDSEPGSRAFEREEEAITAIKEALAQPEQEPLGFMNAGHVHEMQQGRLPYGYVYPKGGVGADIAVYTTPPKRPWVGLMGEEIDAIDQSMCGDREFYEPFARAIEAKLKEKNT